MKKQIQFTEEKRKKSMQFAIYDVIFSSALLSFTTTFLSAFAIYMGADSTYLALLASIPLIFWTVMQLPAAVLVEKTGKRKKINLISTLVARLLWLPIILIPVFFISNGLFFLLLFVTLSSLIGAVASPAWTSMIGDIVPENHRGEYFSKRNKYSVFSGILSLIIATGILFIYPDNAFAFILIFSFGVVAGIISCYFLSKMPEPSFSPGYIKIKDVKKAFSDSKLKKFILIFFIWHTGVNIAGPFFMLRLLKDVGASYFWVPLLAIGTAVMTILTLRLWGQFSDKYGHRVIIIISSFFASFVPLLWIFAPSPEYILLIEMFAGFAWAGFTLAHFNYLLEISPPDKRPVFSSLFWIVFGLGGIIGPLLGAMIAQKYAISSFLGFMGLEVVFFASWMLRIIAVILFILLLEELPQKRAKHGATYVFSEMMKFGLHSSHHTITSIKYAASYRIKKIEDSVKEKVGEKVAIASVKAKIVEIQAEKKLENISRAIDEIAKDIIKGGERIEEDLEEREKKKKEKFEYNYKRKKE